MIVTQIAKYLPFFRNASIAVAGIFAVVYAQLMDSPDESFVRDWLWGTLFKFVMVIALISTAAESFVTFIKRRKKRNRKPDTDP